MRRKKPKIGSLKRVAPDTELEAYTKVLRWFFAFPTDEFTLNELTENVGIAKTTAKVTVQKLATEDFLDIRTIGKTWRIRANQNHHYFTSVKIPYNLELIYGSGVVEYIQKSYPDSAVIILFGSFRKGDDVPGSDVDIAVELMDDGGHDILELDTISQLGYRKNVKVSLHLFSRKSININVFTNIANGIILDGLLEVQK